MKLSHRVAVTAAVLFASATSLAAQSASQSVTAADQKAPAAEAANTNTANTNTTTPAQNAGPAVSSQAPFADNAAVGVRQLAPNAPVPYAPPPRDGTKSQGVALMIVGGAALLAGAIIGNTGGNVIMVGGVVVGAIGLYKYLQ